MKPELYAFSIGIEANHLQHLRYTAGRKMVLILSSTWSSLKERLWTRSGTHSPETDRQAVCRELHAAISKPGALRQAKGHSFLGNKTLLHLLSTQYAGNKLTMYA